MVIDYKYIIGQLPYAKPFLFVDDILEVSEQGIMGTYTYDPEHSFYKGHFVDNPVTPGVILAETMAQIGVVCHGIWLLNSEEKSDMSIALTSMECDFLKPVYPGEKVTVKSERKYFRFGKLKCDVSMHNESGVKVCTGVIAGMIIRKI